MSETSGVHSENEDHMFEENISKIDLNENIQEKVDNSDNKVDYDKLLETVTYQDGILKEKEAFICDLLDKISDFERREKDLESKLENANKQKDSAIKEKESMVIRYAVGEKKVIKEIQQKEATEKKLKDVQRENDIFQHKLQSMITEKSRICQMFDNKCYEYKNVQQELDRYKTDLNSLETKLKWTQNSLKNEIEAHKDTQAKLDTVNNKLQSSIDEIEKTKTDTEETIKNFYTSQENKAYILEQQVKEQQASLILLKHERTDREQQIKNLQTELERLQEKQKEIIQENNCLSLKVQNLEKERLESENKLSELRGCADTQKQQYVDLQTKSVQLEQLKLQLKHEQDQLCSSNEQINLLKNRNQELENDMESCRVREAELLLFTQQLTDKNVRLQSEFTAMETKVQQLSCEQAMLKRQIKEQETKGSMLSSKLSEEKLKYTEEIENLQKSLTEKSKLLEHYRQESIDQKGENVVMKRKFDLSLRELNKELQSCRKKLEVFENSETASNCSSNSSEKNRQIISHDLDQVKVIQPENGIDKQTLLDHIVKLQRISAKKSEKIDFLEEHVNTLVAELQKKTKLLQGYILKEQTGTMTSNSADNNKAKLAKLNGVMASIYSSKVADENLTIELCLDINRKLQAILEDTLLKNITLKENVDTLGNEIDRLSRQVKPT